VNSLKIKACLVRSLARKGGAYKPIFSKSKSEIPKQGRDDKKPEPNHDVTLNLGLMKIRLVSASDLFFLLSARTFHPRPCLPAGRHRTGFLGATLIKSIG
jgi:hypothetical protein